MHLGAEIRQSLQGYFGKLQSSVELVVHGCDSGPEQAQLEGFLQEVADCHERVKFVRAEQSSIHLYFEVHKNGVFSGISFVGIPTGHEFSSLVLAILNVDGQGKQPDKAVMARIRNIRGPVRLRTFISLSCTNCPVVVQHLNLMASLHDDFYHEVIDGAMLPAEVERLQVASVPSVYCEDRLVSAGRNSLGELIDICEQWFGSAAEGDDQGLVLEELPVYDLTVIGAGPAGISAAIYSARKGMKTAIIATALGGQLQDTLGIENFISVIYTEGVKLASQLVKHVQEYPVDILEHRRVKSMADGSEGDQHLKVLTLDSGEVIRSVQVVIATGARWRELGIEGEKTYLGKGVAYCPHCDGPYFKGKDVIVVGGGNSGVEAAIDLAEIVRSVTVFEFQDTLKADKVLVDVLTSRPNAEIKTSVAVESVQGDGSAVTSVRYRRVGDAKKDGGGQVQEFATSAVFVQIGLIPNAQFLQGQLELNDYGEIVVDAKNRTSWPGVYATGDVTTIPYKQIIISMGDGAKAALVAFEDRMIAGNASS